MHANMRYVSPFLFIHGPTRAPQVSELRFRNGGGPLWRSHPGQHERRRAYSIFLCNPPDIQPIHTPGPRQGTVPMPRQEYEALLNCSSRCSVCGVAPCCYVSDHDSHECLNCNRRGRGLPPRWLPDDGGVTQSQQATQPELENEASVLDHPMPRRLWSTPPEESVILVEHPEYFAMHENSDMAISEPSPILPGEIEAEPRKLPGNEPDAASPPQQVVCKLSDEACAETAQPTNGSNALECLEQLAEDIYQDTGDSMEQQDR